MARNKHPEVTVNRIVDAATQLFFTKGYEQTTIQDVIDSLGDLSKGAIYHHFKSKEDIMFEVVERYNGDEYANQAYAESMAMQAAAGLDKLKNFLRKLVMNNTEPVLQIMPDLIKNPKLLAYQLEVTVEIAAKKYIGKLMNEGVADGSIQTDYAGEAAELIGLMLNIWLNPLVFNDDKEVRYRRCKFCQQILRNAGIDVFDDDVIEYMISMHLPG